MPLTVEEVEIGKFIADMYILKKSKTISIQIESFQSF